MLVGCFKASPHGRIRPDDGGAILDLTCPKETRVEEYRRGQAVNHTVKFGTLGK
ncbi:hypothetical protein [Streptomyces yunnanensis]|uniref:Uncharacterized protein n=1 Tax=Streptomyces yunnanensis TaxID=156453 RepID=A0A9X8R077_9ACTN|nr:hypothetical protein [Streptomyces yunnanensis]SHN31583.1 hypothetical protein SAMN05216268_13434 [Streptomyces yunnanensis]